MNSKFRTSLPWRTPSLRAVARSQRLDPDLLLRGDLARDQQREERADGLAGAGGERLEERAPTAHQGGDLHLRGVQAGVQGDPVQLRPGGDLGAAVGQGRLDPGEDLLVEERRRERRAVRGEVEVVEGHHPPARRWGRSARRAAGAAGRWQRISRPTSASTSSSSGTPRMSPARNATWSAPRPCARRRAVSRMAGFASTPTTRPVGPTSSAASKAVSPAPLPRSSTFMPARSRPPRRGGAWALDAHSGALVRKLAAGSQPGRAGAQRIGLTTAGREAGLARAGVASTPNPSAGKL